MPINKYGEKFEQHWSYVELLNEVNEIDYCAVIKRECCINNLGLPTENFLITPDQMRLMIIKSCEL